MHLLILSIVVGLIAAQSTLSPAELEEIFGKPPTPTPTNSPPLEQITVKPTDMPIQLLDKDGDVCQCVPYYLCNKDNIAVDANNVSVTGWGTLDIRFREDDCQESTEVCCKIPDTKTDDVVPWTPDVTLKGCGYRNRKGVDFTITGGTGREAEFGEFPWVVAITDAYNDSYAGVGVLIHPQVVMTGAHIAYRYLPGGVKIRAGEWDTQTVKERLKYQERIVQEIYIHSGFKEKSLKNDFALLLLQEPVQIAPHINTICLPDQDEDFSTYKNCVANGWGKDVFGLQGRYAVILKRVEIDMVPNSRCTQLLKRTRLGHKFVLHDSFVCAGGEAGKDTCEGDGGAPLACPIGNDRYKLTGLVAWGIGCGGKDVPAVYAAVPRVREWVDQRMIDWGLDTNTYKI